MGSYIGKKPSDVPLTSGDITDNIITSSKIVDGTIVNADINDVAATKLSGSIADARVPASAVTQHVTGYDDANIRADITALALREATNEASAAFNLPNQFIDTFATDVLGTKTDCSVADGSVKTVAQVDTSIDIDISDFTTYFGTQAQSDATQGFTIIETANSLQSTLAAFNPTQYSSMASGSYSNVMEELFEPNGDFDSGGSYSMQMSVSANKRYHWLFKFKDGGTFDPSGCSIKWTNGSSGGTDLDFIGVNSSNAVTILDNLASGSVSNATTYSNGSITNSTFFPVIGFAAQWGSGNSIGMGDFDFTGTLRSETTSATGTAIQAANTVASAKTEVSGTMIYKDNAGTATLGTDLKIYFTCNGGSNWTEAASYNAITPVYATGIKQVRLGKTTCTSGTDIRYKAVWANQASGSKETQLHGIGINY